MSQLWDSIRGAVISLIVGIIIFLAIDVILSQSVQDIFTTIKSTSTMAFLFANIGTLTSLTIGIITSLIIVDNESITAAILSSIFAAACTLLFILFLSYYFIGNTAGTLDPIIIVPIFANNIMGIPVFWIVVQVIYCIIYAGFLYLFSVKPKKKLKPIWK